MEHANGSLPEHFTLDEVRRRSKNRPHNWLIEGLLPLGSLVILAGDPKVGKSTLVANLVAAVAEGAPWLGRQTQASPILWVANEESEEEWAFNFSPYRSARTGSMVTVTSSLDPIDTDQGIQQIAALVQKIGAKLIVIDPLTSSCEDEDFDSTGKGRAKLKRLKKAIAHLDCSCIVIHHTSKNNDGRQTQTKRISGSHQLFAAASGAWMMTRQWGSGNRFITLAVTQRMVGSFGIDVVSDGPGSFQVGRAPNRTRRSDRCASQILKLLHTKTRASQKEIVNDTKLSQSTVSKALAKLVESGKIQVNNRTYSLTEA